MFYINDKDEKGAHDKTPMVLQIWCKSKYGDKRSKEGHKR